MIKSVLISVFINVVAAITGGKGVGFKYYKKSFLTKGGSYYYSKNISSSVLLLSKGNVRKDFKMKMIEFFNNTPLDELEVYAYIIAFGSYLLSILAAHSFGYGSTSRKKMYELPCFLTLIMFLIFNEKKINLWAIVMWVYSIIAIMSVLFIKFFDVYSCRFVYGCVIVSFFIILVSICIDFVFFDNKDN